MADNFGVSFSPLDQGNLQGPGGPGYPPGGRPAVSPLQSAVRLLSLRIPRVVGAQALAPAALLNSPGGSLFGGGSLEAFLQRVFGQQRPWTGPVASLPFEPMPTGGGLYTPPAPTPTPPPRVTPGDQPSGTQPTGPMGPTGESNARFGPGPGQELTGDLFGRARRG